MSITLDAELEARVNDIARQQGKTPEQVVSETLREKFIKPEMPIIPLNERERKLLSIGVDCGVSLSNEALSREHLYD